MRYAINWRMVINSLKKAENATLKSSIIILLLSCAKLFVGFFSNSLVLLTDAIHSFTDLITNAASIIGLRIAQKKPDEKFPYGYFKAESLSALFISVFIIYLAYNFLIQGINALESATIPTNPLITITTAFSSIIVSYLLSVYLIKKGKLTNSQSLISNGKEKRIDMITSLVVLLAVVLSYYNIPLIEGFVTILISLFIFWEGLSSVKDAVFSLMDISPSKNYEMIIIKVISEIPGVEGFGGLKLRKAGPIILGEIDIMVRKQVNVKQSRILCNKIESEAKKKINELSDLAVKIYPYEPNEKIIVLPVKDKKILHNSFGRADYFLKIMIKNKKVSSKEMLINPFKKIKIKVGLKVSNFLINQDVDVVIIKKIGEIAENSLNANLVSIYKTKKNLVKSALKEYLNL